jgi:hypothetical protein
LEVREGETSLDEEEPDEREVDVDKESVSASAAAARLFEPVSASASAARLLALLATESRAFTAAALFLFGFRGILGRESYTPCILLRVLLLHKAHEELILGCRGGGDGCGVEIIRSVRHGRVAPVSRVQERIQKMTAQPPLDSVGEREKIY